MLISYQSAVAFPVCVIQRALNKFAVKHNLVGMALAVNNHSYYYGISNKIPHKVVDMNTEFGIGSITKTFVSVILLKLEAGEALNINDKITKYFPQYIKLKNISIKDLMHMSAGLNDVFSSGSASPLEQVKLAYQAYNPKVAGVWRYSNVSYQLLGLLIEKVTHKKLENVIAQLITQPLHLNHIYFPNHKEALSLVSYQDGRASITNFKQDFAAGGLVSNATDLEYFISKLFVDKSILPKKQYRELMQFVETPAAYYAFTKSKAPRFGLGVFQWDVQPYGLVFTYPGVLKNGFASTYVVYKHNVIIAQTNTYNDNDFTLIWPHQRFMKKLMGSLR